MKYLFKKYEYPSQELAETRIAALPHTEDEEGNSHPSHSHTVVKLGYIYIEEPTYNEEKELLTEGVQSDKYSVDILWNVSELGLEEDGDVDYPYGWVSKEIEVEGNGVHTFAGWSYNK